VKNSYPDSLYARLAEFRARECREDLAAHELYVGDYYARYKKADAARARYEYVLTAYPRSDAAVTAREKLDRMGPSRVGQAAPLTRAD
jgi:outer membrane protein assembly factor BamD